MSRILTLWRSAMSNQLSNLGTASARPIPLIPIYAFSLLSALTVSFGLRFEHSARAALLGAGFLFAAIAVTWFAWFLAAAEKLFKVINYWALIFGFIGFLPLTPLFDVSHAFGLGLLAVRRI